jgi:hypothetical protein
MGKTDVLITLSLIGMTVLWLATCFFTVRQSVVGIRLTFLVGLLIAWPMLSFVLGAAMFESTFTGNERPVGPAGLIFTAVGAGVALAVWLVGFWIARIVGWLIRRNRTANS